MVLLYYCRRTEDLDIEVAASGFTKELAADFDEAAQDINMLGGPDDEREEGGDSGDDEESAGSEEEGSKGGRASCDDRDDGIETAGQSGGVETGVSVDADVQGLLENDGAASDLTGDVDCGSCGVEGRDMQPPSAESSSKQEDKGLKDAGSEGEDSGDEFNDISGQNRSYRPFRNEESVQHVNMHLLKARTRNSDSMSSSWSTASTIAPDVIRAKVKSQQRRAQEKQKALRIRKSGEASLQTRLRRETQLDIKESTSAEWF